MKSPASVIQQQFWLLNQMHPESSAYNIPSVFRIKGNLDIAIIEKSINEIISRHEILRTAFTVESEKVLQVISSEWQLTVNTIDLSNIEKTELEDEVNLQIKKEVTRPFDLSSLPMIRVMVLSLPENEYILIIIEHHIITDLRTKDQFCYELSTLYNSYLNGEISPLPEPVSQYSDYSKWHNEWLNSEECSGMNRFWKNQLEGKGGFLNFPADKQRPVSQTFNGRALPLSFDPDFTDALKQISRQNSLNIYLTFLTAYIVLLYRYSCQSDVIVGVPLTNRRKDAYKDTAGPFVNILPLSPDLSGAPSFKEMLRRVRFAMLDAHRNQEIPVQSILNGLQLGRDVSYNPLYQAGFTFEHPMELTLNNLIVEPIITHSGGSQLDMFMTLWESHDGVQGFIEYNTDLFKEDTIDRLSNNYLTMLKEVINDDERSISSIPVLSETEKKQILVDWNDTDKTFAKAGCTHELFEKQADKNPDAIAAIFEEKNITYKELNQKSNQLAHFLRAKGLVKNDFVGIFVDRSLDMIIALLGVLKAGGAYVPIDPEFPEERISYMLDHSRAPILLVKDCLRDKLHNYKAQIISLDGDWNDIACQAKDNPSNRSIPEDLAYVIYTSGSTGRPKGVQVHHGAVVNFLNSMAQHPGMEENDIMLAVTTLSFDIAVLELFLPLIVGAATVIAGHEIAIDGARLLDAISKYDVTILQATPVTWRLLIQAGWKGGDGLKVLCGGEALPKDLTNGLVERSPYVWNMYGPTETTVWSTCAQLQETDETISVGKPIANTQVYILDNRMQPVPVAVSGEMYIGGAGVSKGYLNQPHLTAGQFVQNPFSDVPNARLYKTGDMARYLSDGNIELLGRYDQQIKIHGYRIELGEIETIVALHPEIDQAVVVMNNGENKDAHLIAYYTLRSMEKPATTELRGFLASKLPDYMIPSIYITVDTIPLTPNGKIDRLALPGPDKGRPDLEQEYVPPESELERMLSDIWCGVLNLNKVGVNDRFFDIGGTSIMAVNVISRVQENLNREISVVKFFQYPTIKLFAGYLINGKSNETARERILERGRRKRDAFGRKRRKAALMNS